MSSTAHSAPPSEYPVGKIGMWVFLGSDAMGFATFVVAYVVLRMSQTQWIGQGLPPPPIGLTGFNTFLLICSSLTMVLALEAVQKGDQKGLVRWLGATMAGGTVFLLIQAYEWSHLISAGMTPWSGQYGATFYACTGYHGLHVLAGVIYIGCVLVGALRGRIGTAEASMVEILGLYWHFVDLVWILLFTIIYLL